MIAIASISGSRDVMDCAAEPKAGAGLAASRG